MFSGTPSPGLCLCAWSGPRALAASRGRARPGARTCAPSSPLRASSAPLGHHLRIYMIRVRCKLTDKSSEMFKIDTVIAVLSQKEKYLFISTIFLDEAKGFDR